MTAPHIGIDLLGSDTSPKQLLDGVLRFLHSHKPKASITLFVSEELVEAVPRSHTLHVVSCPEAIQMDDNPLKAIRAKKRSSLCMGIDRLKEGQIDAFVSAGNTGALMCYAKLRLPSLKGVAKLALLTLLPTKHGEVAVLDVGANVSYQAKHLLQFALMGIAYQKSRGIAQPLVGLLNIGTEEKKGTPELRKAFQLLQKLPHFVGNIEGRDVFQKELDVLITDGFTGNVFLKTAEGIAAAILDQLEQNAQEECSPQLKEVLTALRHRLHYAEYPGAILCGIDGIVLKCHGTASPQNFVSSLTGAITLVENCFLDKLKTLL